jgi:hypothetical protein
MSKLLHIIKQTSTLTSRKMIDDEVTRLEGLVKYFVMRLNEDGHDVPNYARHQLRLCQCKLKMYEQFKKNTRYYYTSRGNGTWGSL